MNLKHHIIAGQRFGGRVVTREVDKLGIHRRVEVRCDCGHIGQAEVRALVLGECHHCPTCAQLLRNHGSREAKAEHEARKEAALEARRQAHQAKIEHRQLERRTKTQALRDAGMKMDEIAAQLGCTISYISLILAGKR